MARSIKQSALDVLGKLRFPVRYPTTVVEINPDAVTAVRLKAERSGQKRLVGYGIVPLRTPLVAVPLGGGGVHHPKVAHSEELQRAVAEAVQSAGIRPGKASLILPDMLARVWLLQLPELPRGQGATLEMIRWKIKRGLNFRVEDTAIAWQILARPVGAEPAVVLVGVVPRAVIREYEAVLAAAGLKIGLVDLSSFNLFNAYRHAIVNGAASEDFSVLNATEAYFTLMLFRRGEMVFFRCKAHAEGEPAAPDERARTFRRELASSLSYYTEKLKGAGLARTYARIADPALEDAAEVLDALGFGVVEQVDPSRIAKLPEEIHESTALYLAPAMGAASGRRG